MQRQHSNGSAAYDLDNFRTRTPRARSKKPTLTVTRPSRSVRARRRLATAMKVAAVIAIGVAVVVMMLYYRAVLTELTLQISSERTKLNEEISEGTRLAAELEEWFLFYKEVWRSVSRESELYRIQDVVFGYADLLRG